MLEFDRTSIIGEVVAMVPQVIPMFEAIGMHCFMCAAAAGETAKGRRAQALRQAESEAEAAAEELRQSTENKCSAMRARAEARMEDAAKRILRAVTGD